MKFLSFVMLLLLQTSNGIEAQKRDLKPFSVTHSIEMVKLIDPVSSTNEEPSFKTSTDGSYFTIVTRKGNLKTDQNDYELCLYETEKVLAYVNSQGNLKNLPESKLLARFSSSTNDDAIKNVQWLSNDGYIAFIAHSGKEPAQVYSINIHSHKLKQVTHHYRSVNSFNWKSLTDDLIFTSSVDLISKEKRYPNFLIGTRFIEEVENPDLKNKWGAYKQYYLQHYGETEAVPTGKVFEDNGGGSPELWMSPDGNWTISAVSVPMKEVPESWFKEYDSYKNSRLFQQIASFDENFMTPRQIFYQYVLNDVSNGNSQPIFNAPTGLMEGLVKAIWKDNSNVIIANTYLPLNINDEIEKDIRKKAPLIVEYNIRTKEIITITQLVPAKDMVFTERLSGMELSVDGTLVLYFRAPNESGKGDLPPRYFRKEESKWIEVKDAPVTKKKAEEINPLVLSIHQDLNTAPEIMALDSRTQKSKIITNLNPQFGELCFGKTEIFKWVDKDGKDWSAGLLYPVDYEKGNRYPLVIQTHGFNPDEFFIDGPFGSTAGFAAQPLANKGFIVMQFPDRLEGLATRKQMKTFQKGVESVIDTLDHMGMLDREKVGLIGWSATGANVQHVITFSDYKIAAASIEDAHSIGLSTYVFFYGFLAPGMLYMEDMVDARPWGEYLKTWVENDPTYHLDNVTTPLRIEQFNHSALAWWDTYAILKRLHRPVEFLMYPDAAHSPVKPLERLATQQGNVDWFTFWLKGEKNPDPAKEEQYKRWRKLRVQYEALMKEKKL